MFVAGQDFLQRGRDHLGAMLILAFVATGALLFPWLYLRFGVQKCSIRPAWKAAREQSAERRLEWFDGLENYPLLREFILRARRADSAASNPELERTAQCLPAEE